MDFDSAAIEYAKKHLKDTNITFIDSHFLNMNFGLFDAIVSLDVIEHVDKSDEDAFFKTINTNLKDHGVCIIGTPNENSSQHASESSKKGHVNLFTAERLYNTLSQYFHNVFLFGMNDEVVHTGFYPMCH